MGEFNESDLLRRIARASRTLAERFPRRIAFGPGDDMGAVVFADTLLLAAVDQVILGRHVAVDTPWRLIGRKAVARNLSDVAAMAARPVACLASVAMPPMTPTEQAMELFEGVRSTAEAYGCPLIGGDTAAHASDDHPLVVSVTILADTPPQRGPIRRVGARVGDRLYVTGRLGGSFGADGRGRHLSFRPRVAEATELVERIGAGLHAMIDLSDGLGRDGARIAEASSVRLRIDADRLPCAPGCDWRNAMSDGEDYELLFAADGVVPPRLGDVSVTEVGEVLAVEDPNGARVEAIVAGAVVDASAMGWEHGKGASP